MSGGAATIVRRMIVMWGQRERRILRDVARLAGDRRREQRYLV